MVCVRFGGCSSVTSLEDIFLGRKMTGVRRKTQISNKSIRTIADAIKMRQFLGLLMNETVAVNGGGEDSKKSLYGLIKEVFTYKYN